MASRTYREEVVGPQSTNRFVVPRTFPTTVVTGATTKAASAQPNLTGRPKKIDPVQDTAGSPNTDPTPIDIPGLSDKELTTMGKTGFPGGWMSPGSIVSGVVPGGTGIRALNIYGARQEIMARLTTPGLRADESEMIVSPPMSSKETARDMKERNKKVTLADRGYGEGGDGQGDAVGAHPDTDDLGPDSGQGDTEATWGG